MDEYRGLDMWGTDTGRWRNSEYDDKITYETPDASTINIVTTYTDGTKSVKSYRF